MVGSRLVCFTPSQRKMFVREGLTETYGCLSVADWNYVEGTGSKSETETGGFVLYAWKD